MPKFSYTYGDYNAARLADYPDTSFAVLSDIHYNDTALGTSGAAFEQTMNSDRKLLQSRSYPSALLMIKGEKNMKKALILYCSITGNTKKIAYAIEAGLTEGGLETTLLRYQDAQELDYLDYELVCVGAPSYSWSVPQPFNEFLKKKFSHYKSVGKILPNSPRIGKKALVFCSYAGPHTGIDEAIPTGLYMGQFFDHMGFDVLDKWYILSEFVGSEEMSTLGRMGDIRGLPSQEGLCEIQEKARKLAASIN